MRLGWQAAIVGLAGWLAGADARAGPAAGVVVIAEGLEAQALGEALALRVPEARVAAGCEPGADPKDSCSGCGPGCTLARLRREDGALRIEVRHADGRVFTRTSAAETDEPERAAAASLSHLLAAIEEGTATPAEVVAEPEPEPVAAAPVSPAAAPVRPAVAPNDPSRDGPRIEIGPVVGLAGVFGVGQPTALAGLVGDGGLVGVELRARRGLLAGVELRGAQARDGAVHLARLRVAVTVGHSLRRGLFELRTRAALTVEPWWVTARSEGARATFGAPLLGGSVSVTPGLSGAIAPRVRVFVGLRLEAGLSVDARTGAVVQVVDQAALFRLGGVELAAAAEIGVRWGISGRASGGARPRR